MAVRYFDFEKDKEVEGVIEEMNGSLAYVRDQDGNAEWRSRQELTVDNPFVGKQRYKSRHRGW